MQDYFLESCGIAYRTNEYQNERQTLVFIHGLSGSSSVWLPYEKYFQDIYNIVTFDLRGHGKSRKRRHYHDYSLSAFARDVRELLTHLRIHRYILINHSFGTLVGLEHLHTHSDGISAIVFLSPNYGVHGSLRARIAQPFLVVLVRIATLFPFSPEPRGRTDYSRFKDSGDFTIRRIIADLRNTSMRVYFYCLEHAYRFNRTVWWNQIQKPTLIIHGEKDKIIPFINAVRMSQAMPHAKLVILKDTDHVMVINDIPETDRALEGFLEAHR